MSDDDTPLAPGTLTSYCVAHGYTHMPMLDGSLLDCFGGAIPGAMVFVPVARAEREEAEGIRWLDPNTLRRVRAWVATEGER